jgi:hypothetical protein
MTNHAVTDPNLVKGMRGKSLSPQNIMEAKDFQVVSNVENMGVHNSRLSNNATVHPKPLCHSGSRETV